MIMVVAYPDEDHGEETTCQGSAHSLQYPASLADHNHWARKNLGKLTFFNISVAHLIVRFLCFFIIGEGDPHCVLT